MSTPVDEDIDLSIPLPDEEKQQPANSETVSDSKQQEEIAVGESPLPWVDLYEENAVTSDGKPTFLAPTEDEARKAERRTYWPLHKRVPAKLGYVFGKHKSKGQGYYSMETKEGYELLLDRLLAKEKELKRIESVDAAKDAKGIYRVKHSGCCGSVWYETKRPRSQYQKERDVEYVEEATRMRAFCEARLQQDSGPMAPIPWPVMEALGAKEKKVNISETWALQKTQSRSLGTTDGRGGYCDTTTRDTLTFYSYDFNEVGDPEGGG